MVSQLYNQKNYDSKVPFIISKFIREYDMSKANINVFYKYGCITSHEYNYYCNCGRDERERAMGILQLKKPELKQILAKGIIEAKKMLFEANNLQDQDILMIKNDAVLVINKNLAYTTFDNIEFKNKNIYTSYYILGDYLRAYYLKDPFNKREVCHIDGISDQCLELHREYFFDFLLACFESAEVDDPRDTINMIYMFYNRYINLELDKGFYRMFDSLSRYDVNIMGHNYKASFISDNQKNCIDINYNKEIIKTLWSYYGSPIFKYRNR